MQLVHKFMIECAQGVYYIFCTGQFFCEFCDYCSFYLVSGMLAKLGEIKPSWSGNGKLMKKETEDLEDGKKPDESIQLMGMGLVTAMMYYLLGTYINKFIPSLHTYAWMIILVALSKAFGIVPKKMEHAAQQWSQFFLSHLSDPRGGEYADQDTLLKNLWIRAAVK